VLENIHTKYDRNDLTAKSVNFDHFSLNLKMTKLNSQTKMPNRLVEK